MHAHLEHLCLLLSQLLPQLPVLINQHLALLPVRAYQPFAPAAQQAHIIFQQLMARVLSLLSHRVLSIKRTLDAYGHRGLLELLCSQVQGAALRFAL